MATEQGLGRIRFPRIANELYIMLVIASSIWFYTSLQKFPFMVPSNYSDVGFLYFRDVIQGGHNMGIPYVDYKLEYPPLIGAVIWLGQAFGTYFPFLFGSYDTYVLAESILQYPFVIGTVFNTYRLCEKLGIDTKRVYLYLLSTLTFIIYGFYNWDFIVAYFVTLSIRYYLDKRFDASSLALTGGILSKFIPLAMAPAMVACLPNNRARVRFIIIAVTVWGLVNIPFALANPELYSKLYTHTRDHQLQNTWISMVISLVGLGDVVTGREPGHFLSLGIIGYLILRSLATKHTPLEKILMSWYAWYGAIYLFDPQMFIQLFPIVIITPNFNFLLYRIADILNALIILLYFIGGSHPELPELIKDQLTPFGMINTFAALRQIIFLGAYFICFNQALQARLKRFAKSLISPIQETRAE